MAARRCVGIPGRPCRTWLQAGGRRCSTCARLLEQRRGGREERGYGSAHQAARRALAATLPAPCGYCGRLIYPGDRWDAAHRVDGRPECGYVVACPGCNQRAKARHG